ncbi:MAG TPA: hypothetical protein VFX15_03155 [Actinomycetes bacterium]|nr:hypothetical protein [Actinomycetes bacterium]
MQIDKLREKAWAAYDKLANALDEDGHNADCVLRCMSVDCWQEHSCAVCVADGEV